ncbi:MAG: RluA family pseudouridine synthase [Candidatus Aminicenantes bacterium]|nr:RluA family pseudouridine synthase [Candidatus Aminicenantes bacterium]
MKENIDLNRVWVVTDEDEENSRLDLFIASHMPELSRSRIQKIIRAGDVRINGLTEKSSHRIQTGDRVELTAETTTEQDAPPEGFDIPLDIIYVDEDVIVINKPPGLVVHPGAGHLQDTLVNALLFHYPEIRSAGLPERPGIVHRLDKETSGVLVTARTSGAYIELQRQFKDREISKHYFGLVWGNIPRSEGTIDMPIGRHVKYGDRMSVKTNRPRRAETAYKVKKRFVHYTLLDLFPVTGRTHQLRVHLSASGFPIVGDTGYGKKKTSCPRLFLHAFSLEFSHPSTGKRMKFSTPLPSDLRGFLTSIV